MPLQQRLPVVRAIDVGFGNNKFTTRSYQDGCGTDLFPSLAPLSHKGGATDKTGSMLSVGEVIHVMVDGAKFTVGKDVNDAAATNNVRALEAEFPLSKPYAALVKGALYQMLKSMEDETIDLLVLGLPLNNYDLYRADLRKKMIGKHYLPNPLRETDKNAPAEIVCNVLDVLVIPQPIGAFLAYIVPRNMNSSMSNQINMVLDVGRGTFDWFVSRGNRPLSVRCGACFGGVSKVVQAVASAEDPKHKENLNMMDMIEFSLHTHEPVFIRSKPVDLFQKHQAVIDSAIRESVSSMLNSVGDISDIKNIIVTGGGANLFLGELEKALPDYDLIIDKNPIFPNVIGFQIAGEQIMAGKLKAT